MTTHIQKFERRALRPKEAARAYGVSRTISINGLKPADWRASGSAGPV
jgi:hypothetical protein